jgi:hypothetical protein
MLLLVIVACGVVQMHVFGHAAGEHDGYAGAVSAAAPAMAGPWSPTGHPPVGGGAPGPEQPPDVLSMCLAIVAAAGIAAAVVLLRRWLAAPTVTAVSRLTACRRRWGRDPPLRVPRLSRRLASLSVLRI